MPRVARASTKARRKDQQERRRAEVLDIAAAVFEGRGYPATTTDEIAEKAGVSVGTIYNLFKNKEQLYGVVTRRIGTQLLNQVRRDVLPLPDFRTAIEHLIRLRLLHYGRQRLFFVLFSCERSSGVYPDPDTLPGGIVALYYQYLDLVAKVFERGINAGSCAGVHPLHLAVSFEGILSAFASYWARPEGAESPGDHVKQVTETFLRMVAGAAVGLAGREPAAGDRACERELYMSALDTNRLKELIAVVRGFGDDQRAVHLNALEQELARARVFDFQSVPYDVVTMNTRLRIRDLATGKTETHRIVYPVDLEKAPENTSVLAPLGTALLGYRVGSVVEAECDGVPRRYEVAEILYQPEAAGDYHL